MSYACGVGGIRIRTCLPWSNPLIIKLLQRGIVLTAKSLPKLIPADFNFRHILSSLPNMISTIFSG